VRKAESCWRRWNCQRCSSGIKDIYIASQFETTCTHCGISKNNVWGNSKIQWLAKTMLWKITLGEVSLN